MKQLTVTSGSDSQLKPSTENESVSTTVKATLEHRAVQTEDLTDQTQSIDYRMCTDGKCRSLVTDLLWTGAF